MLITDKVGADRATSLQQPWKLRVQTIGAAMIGNFSAQLAKPFASLFRRCCSSRFWGKPSIQPGRIENWRASDLMWLSNRSWGVKPEVCLDDAAGCMVVFAVDIGRRMMELRGASLQCGRRTSLRQRCNPISGMARLTSRQGRLRRSDPERYPVLRCGSRTRIKELTGFKHRVHYHRQFARHSHSSSFEADPLPQLKSPCAQGALG